MLSMIWQVSHRFQAVLMSWFTVTPTAGAVQKKMASGTLIREVRARRFGLPITLGLLIIEGPDLHVERIEID